MRSKNSAPGIVEFVLLTQLLHDHASVKTWPRNSRLSDIDELGSVDQVLEYAKLSRLIRIWTDSSSSYHHRHHYHEKDDFSEYAAEDQKSSFYSKNSSRSCQCSCTRPLKIARPLDPEQAKSGTRKPLLPEDLDDASQGFLMLLGLGKFGQGLACFSTYAKKSDLEP